MDRIVLARAKRQITTECIFYTSHYLLQVELWNSNAYLGSTIKSPPPLIPSKYSNVPPQRVSTVVLSSY